jgi:hypothetical protein
MLERWRAAGYPKCYTEDVNGKRILDAEARREALEDRAHPAVAALRRLKGALDYRLSLRRLNK